MSVPDRAVDRPLENTQVLLASRPTGVPTVDNFRIASAPIPRLGPGEVLLRTIFLSLDPYMRARMNAGGSYAAPVEVGSVMTGGTVSEVCASNHDDFEIGDVVLAHCGWQKFGVQPGAELRKLDPDVAPVSTALGVLGMPGFTAYAGLAEIGRPKAGETVVVAAASGPVGSTVGQLARIAGARVVGIVGGQRKVEHIRELGFDEALDHRAADFGTQLERATPDGIDVTSRMSVDGSGRRCFRDSTCTRVFPYAVWSPHTMGPKPLLARTRARSCRRFCGRAYTSVDSSRPNS
jgi:NADPH-dependent curcumin reductase CurA